MVKPITSQHSGSIHNILLYIKFLQYIQLIDKAIASLDCDVQIYK